MSVHDTQHYPEIKRLLGIPEDEPIFILRAQDDSACPMLDEYIQFNVRPGNDPSWLDNMRQTANEFNDWQVKNSDKVKQPD